MAFILIFWGMKRGGGNEKLCVYNFVLTLSKLRDEEGGGGRRGLMNSSVSMTMRKCYPRRCSSSVLNHRSNSLNEMTTLCFV